MGKSHTLGEEVKRLRNSRALTQVEVATASGVTQGYLTGIENGRKERLGAEVLFRLSDALGVPVEHWRPWIVPQEAVPVPEPEAEVKKKPVKKPKK